MNDGPAGRASAVGRVLVVDDDEQMRKLLQDVYERSGWSVVQASSGQTALRMLYETRPDAVVLDVDMAGLDGWATLSRIREIADVPVLMLTGHLGELEKVRAFKGGADDYVTKPFGRQELVARTEALVRRAGSGHDRALPTRYDDGVIAIDSATRMVTAGGSEVVLTPLEYRLLMAFVDHPLHVLSAAQLLQLAWEGGTGTRDQVKIYVGYLRRKLGACGEHIETVRGFGYRYRPPVSTRRDAAS